MSRGMVGPAPENPGQNSTCESRADSDRKPEFRNRVSPQNVSETKDGQNGSGDQAGPDHDVHKTEAIETAANPGNEVINFFVAFHDEIIFGSIVVGVTVSVTDFPRNYKAK